MVRHPGGGATRVPSGQATVEADRGRRAAENLRPARTALLPRRGTLLRMVVAAAMITLAAGVLWLPPAGSRSGPAGQPGPTGQSEPAEQPGPAPQSGPAGHGDSPPDSPPDSSPAAPSGPGPALPPGTVGVPVRMTEPAVVAVVRPGSRIDLLLVPTSGGATPVVPTVLAARALVIDVTEAGPVDGAGALYLALAPDQALRVVAAPADARFGVVVRS